MTIIRSELAVPDQPPTTASDSAQTGAALVAASHRAALERLRQQPLPPREPPSIHYSELPVAAPDSPLFVEWNTYRREVGRLLADGHEGCHILIKGEQILGLWKTRAEAMAVGYRLFLGQCFLVHQVQVRERLLGPISVRPCPKILTR